MDDHLISQLSEDYPELFHEDAFVECPNGWYSLIDAVSATLNANTEIDAELTIVQIKQKYGELRIGTEPAAHQCSDVANGILALAREMSKNICETCGSTQEVEVYGGQYVESLCPYCADES